MDFSPTHIVILLVVILVLFGSTRLPGAASAIGKSMHIFKRSVQGLDENGKPIDDPSVTQATVVQPPAVAQPLPGQTVTQDATQQQLQDIQRQLQDLQRQTADGNGVNGAPAPDPQRSQPL